MIAIDRLANSIDLYLMETAMNQSGRRQSGASITHGVREDPPPALADAAAAPGVDPCDVACAALPAHVAGDLDPSDEAWLEGHTAECGYCRNQLGCYDRLDECLEACCAPPLIACTPPTVTLPQSSPRRARSHTRTSPAWWTVADSPIGPLRLVATERGLALISFAASESEQSAIDELARRGLSPFPESDAPPSARAVLDLARAELDEYFSGRRRDFDLPLDWWGVTPFTRDTLEATAAVPFGRLETYGGIAGRIGKPGASRAVGNALGSNPLPVIVPCHRIVASGGGIGGYTGGLGIKQRLLAIEGVALPG